MFIKNKENTGFIAVYQDGTYGDTFIEKSDDYKSMKLWEKEGNTVGDYRECTADPLLLRQIAYYKEDCTLERLTELTLENNTAEIESLKKRHSAIRLRIPKVG